MSVKNGGRPQIKITHKGKALRVDWSELAKMTSIALKNASSGPGLLDTGEWKPDLDRLEWFAILKSAVDQHIQAHGSDSAKTVTPDIRYAITVSLRLTEILTLGFATSEHRQFMPIEIAAIARTVNAANKIKAKGSRRRGNELMDAKLEAMSREPGLTWKELLLTLEGDEIVTQWNDVNVVWRDVDGNVHTTATGTFQNWKNKPKS